MKKIKIFTLVLLLSVALIVGCSNSQPVAQDNNQPVQEPTQTTVVPAQQPVQEPLKPTRLEIAVGSDGVEYNGNKEGLQNSLFTFSAVGREVDNLEDDKFYLENLWDVHPDYSKTGSNHNTLVIKTTAKSISLVTESQSYTDLEIYKGTKYLPDNEAGSSVGKTVSGVYGVKTISAQTLNIVKRTNNEPAVYSVISNRNGLKVYKIILEY